MKFYKNPTEELSDLLVNLAVIYYKQNLSEKALECAFKAYGIKCNIFGDRDKENAKCLHILIRIYKEMKDV